MSTNGGQDPAADAQPDVSDYGTFGGYLIEGRERLKDAPAADLTEQERLAYAEAAEWSVGPPLQILHVWRLALQLCLARADPGTADVQVVGRIAAKLLGGSPLGPVAERPNAFPAYEGLLLASIHVGSFDIAWRTVERLGQLTNSLFLRTGLGRDYLAARPPGQWLVDAVRLAFDHVRPDLSVACIELGRMKLLSAIASGLTTANSDDLHATERTRPTPQAQALDEVRSGVDVDRAIDLVGALEDTEVGRVLTEMSGPWVRLQSVGARKPHDVPGAISDTEWALSLLEPSSHWIARQLHDRQVLIYPIVDRQHLGIVVVRSSGLRSIIFRKHELEDLGLVWPSSDACLAAGSLLHGRVSESDPDLGDPAKWADLRFVDWDQENSAAVRQLISGWSLAALDEAEHRDNVSPGPDPIRPAIMPSARMLARVGPRPGPSPDIWFLGDPAENLMGPWLEAAAWHAWTSGRVHLRMGSSATCDAFFEALRTGGTVVVSGHAVPPGHGGHFQLQLHDGLVRELDLLSHADTVTASKVLLSCCSAGALDRGHLRAEMLGLSTALLAMGVREVLAPVVPVPDIGASAIGRLLAAETVGPQTLRSAMGRAEAKLLALERADERVAFDVEPPDWLRDACPHGDLAEGAREFDPRRLWRMLQDYVLSIGWTQESSQ